MSFVHPSMLWGLLLVLIPIIIHFFSFKRLKTVKFSSIEFLINVEEKVKNKRRLKHYLILASRILFIIFMVLAFARPISDNSLKANSRTILYLDNSFSMSSEVAEGQSALDEAILYAQSMLKTSTIDAQFFLLHNEKSIFTKNWNSGRQVQDQLAEVSYSTSPTNFSSALQQLSAIDIDFKLIVLSDFQRNTYDEVNWDTYNFEIELVPFKYFNGSNAYVDSAYIDSEVILDGESSNIKINIRNSGSSDIEELNVKLVAGSTLLSSESISLPAMTRKEMTVQIRSSELLDRDLIIQLNDQPVSFDNNFYISLPEVRKPNITILKNDNNIKSPFESVYANSNLFELNVMPVDVAEYSLIQSSDLLVLDQLRSIPDWVYTFDRGDIVLVPHKENSKGELERFLKRDVEKVDFAKSKVTLKDIDGPYSDGVFSNTNEQNLSFPESSIDWLLKNPDVVILENQFGQNYFSYADDGIRKYFIGTDLDLENSNFSRHALFVPLFYRVAQFSVANNRPLSYTIGDEVVSIPFKQGMVEKVTMTNDGLEIFPEYRSGPNNLLLRFPESGLKTGHYDVVVADSIIDKMAFNLESRESQLQQLDFGELQEIAEQAENLSFNDTGSLYQLEARGTNISGYFSYWKLSLLLAIFFIFIEVFLIRYLK